MSVHINLLHSFLMAAFVHILLLICNESLQEKLLKMELLLYSNKDVKKNGALGSKDNINRYIISIYPSSIDI